VSALDATLVYFESPHRAAASLAALADVMPGRRAVLARELTKLHEEVVRGTVEDVAEQIGERTSLKGEVVLLVGPPLARVRARANESELQAMIDALVSEGVSKSEAVKRVSAQTGVPRSEVYDVAHRPRSKN